jgi:hypothetical protein
MVIRAELELSICDLRGAGGGDAISASIDPGTVTWLNRPGLSPKRGGRYTYDLMLGRVRKLADIEGLWIEKVGHDDFCISEVRLLVNDRPIFARSFGDGLWLASSLEISGTELRSNPVWAGYSWSFSEWVASTGAAISRRELVERLESSIGTAIHDAGLRWDAEPSAPISVSRRDATTIAVEAALVRPIPRWLNEHVELGFDLSLCSDGRADATVRSVTLRSVRHWYSFATSASAAEYGHMVDVLRGRLTSSRTIDIVGDVCPQVDVDGNVVYAP